MTKIIVKFDLEKDAWNWWHACNKKSHGKDWKMSIDKNLRDHIVGRSQQQAFEFLIPYLENFYKDIDIDKFVIDTQEGFDRFAEKIFERIEKVSKRPIYHKNITCFITSFPRYPYDYKNGYIWISYKKPIDYQISIFIHELLHFQFFAYYGEKAWAELGPEKHADLKEAMTIILDEEFADITSVKDKGYEKHKDLRKKFKKLWLDTKDMDEFIDQAINLMKDDNL